MSLCRNAGRTSAFDPCQQIAVNQNPERCRFIVRDFVYSEEQIDRQREELELADTTEKELWVRNRTRRASPHALTFRFSRRNY